MYVSDFYDKRTAHPDPDADWDRSNGRIYKVEAAGAKPAAKFDLAKKSSRELVELLKHPNKWWRNTARQMIAERGDATVHPKLRKWLLNEKGQPWRLSAYQRRVLALAFRWSLAGALLMRLLLWSELKKSGK